MSSNRNTQREDALFRVMNLLNENPALSTRDIAKAIGISNGAAYYVISELMKKGSIKLGNFKNNPSKKQYIYLLTPKGIREKSVLTYRFIERKKKEFEELREELNTLIAKTEPKTNK